MTKPMDTEMARLIHALWERNQDQVQNRLQLLDSAAAASRDGDMGEELRNEAREIAHKLAGSLGMFGFPVGSEIARRLELLFDRGDPDPELLSELTVQLRGSLAEPD
ncbi:MAG TPA: Hpt domain-containing protein [Thermoanaerobaculia bacterium]|jgi:HPt (histidine-containing phosphotransfer) domain-containing protein|nr:Hpt domain-containing protein [Granulicella sp.]